VDILLAQSSCVSELAAKVEPQLRTLTASWVSGVARPSRAMV
jgi:hypothetical protein